MNTIINEPITRLRIRVFFIDLEISRISIARELKPRMNPIKKNR